MPDNNESTPSYSNSQPDFDDCESSFDAPLQHSAAEDAGPGPDQDVSWEDSDAVDYESSGYQEQYETRDDLESYFHNIDLGRRGEDAAAAFLRRRGFDVIDRNWTCNAGEADIIAYDEDGLHFIEVKTRMSNACGFPAEAVGAEKRARYERIAELYLREYDGPESAITFDVISILVTGKHRAFLRMHRNVFSDDCC